MSKTCKFYLNFLIVFVMSIMFTSYALATLENGVPFNTSINGKTFANIGIVVPDGAIGMTVSITKGSGELDLYLKYGSPVSGATVGELDADADIRSDGPGADETISITSTSTPALRAGTWYAATLNLNDVRTSFTITATIDTGVDHTVVFGSVVVGQTARKSIKLSNPGSSSRIITAINITGTDAARFWATPDCPTIPAGGSHTIDLTFQPVSTGTKSAQLIVSSDNKTYPILTIALTGTGIAATTGEMLPLPTGKTDYPPYPPVISALTGKNPAICKPIGVGDVAANGDTVSIEIKLDNPSGPYDAYLALQAPSIDPNEFFMLGQDGAFHPFSQSGLVKWKQSASGNIDEKPFGEFPASLLPGGSYKFNLLLTAADSRDAYYLWQTSFSVPETQIDVPDGSVDFFNGTLVVPNATILSGGQIYENSAPVPEDELTAIKKDGKIYLYHPAMGRAKLSEDNTKLAVGYFMTGLSTSEINAIKMGRGSFQPKRDGMSRSASPAELPVPMLNTVGDEISLYTNVNIKLLSRDGLIEATNNRKRFAMIKTGDQNKNKYLLTPMASVIPTEILEYINYGMSGGETRDDIEASDKIESFGAFIRLSQKSRWGFFSDNQLKAIEKDKSVVISLNKIDMTYFILEGIRQIADLVIPTTCASVAINGIARTVETGVTYLFSGDQHASWSLAESGLQGVSSNLIECCTQAALTPTVVGALTMEAVDTFIGIVSLGQWKVEEVFETLLTAYYGETDAYDMVMLGINDILTYTSFDPSSRVFSEVVRDMEEGTSWSGLTTTASSHWPLAITPGGVILSYWEAESEDKIITIDNWGTGTRVDISEVCKIDDLEPQIIGMTNAGRLFFRSKTCWEERTREGRTKSVCKRGIYTVMADGTDYAYVPIVLDQTEYHTFGYDNIEVETLSVSRNGKVLVFSTYEYPQHKLYTVDSFGRDPRLIAISDQEISSIHLSSSGDKILFDYTPQGASDQVPCVAAADGSKMTQLSTLPSGDIYVDAESANISPDGIWIAYGKGSLNPASPQFGIAFIRSDGSDYHYVNTGNVVSVPGNPITFLADSNSIIFSGVNATVSNSHLDLFILSNDKDQPGLRNMTNTPSIDEFQPVVLQ